MGAVELILTAIGLSMDAFAVSACKGLGMRRIDWKMTLILAAAFGGFQGLMPLIGWFLGSRMLWLIEPIDHWIAFGLLGFIGAKMIIDALGEPDDADTNAELTMGEVLVLAVATSIDALAVGISLAALNVDIVFAAGAITLITFCLSIVGVLIGNASGRRFEKHAAIAGGVILIGLGVKILLEHLGIIG